MIEVIKELVLEELRVTHDMSKKMSIASVVFVSYEDDMRFADLLYSGQPLEHWFEKINNHFNRQAKTVNEDYVNSFEVDNQTEIMFGKLIEGIKKKFDGDGYFKAIHEGDEFAVAVYDITKIIKANDYFSIEVIK